MKIDTKFQISFMPEPLLMKSIEHPAIVKFYGLSFNSFEKLNRLKPTILMEYVENGSLEKILELEKVGQAPPEWTNAKKYQCLLGVSHAMKCLHENQIIHRGLKPGNVLMDKELLPRVSDFGLSRCFREEDSVELSKTTGVGTPKYMAPELLQCKKDYSPSVDVYALGVMAYEIATGLEPYVKSGQKLTQDILFKRVLENNELPEYPDDVFIRMKCLITSCLSFNPFDLPGIDITITDDEKRTYLHQAAERGNESIPIHLLSLNRIPINAKDESGRTVLHYAYENTCLNLIRNLVKQPELVVTAKDNKEMNILHIACKALDDINVIRFIVSLNKINVNDRSRDGNTPLLYLCDKSASAESVQIIKYFSSLKDVDLTATNEEKQNVFHILYKNDNLQLVKYFVSLDKIIITAKDDEGRNPLHIACEEGSLDLVKYLVKLELK